MLEDINKISDGPAKKHKPDHQKNNPFQTITMI